MNVADNENLDWFERSCPSQHPVFGKIMDQQSFDVCVKISKTPTNQDDCPNTPVKMISVTIEGGGGGGGGAAPARGGPEPAQVRASHLLIKNRNSRNPVSRRTGQSTDGITEEQAKTQLMELKGKLTM